MSRRTKYLYDMLHCTCSNPEGFFPNKYIIFGLKIINDWCTLVHRTLIYDSLLQTYYHFFYAIDSPFFCDKPYFHKLKALC